METKPWLATTVQYIYSILTEKFLNAVSTSPSANSLPIFLSKSYIDSWKNRSVRTQMLSFLQRRYFSMKNNLQADVMAIYNDISKAFENVPHWSGRLRERDLEFACWRFCLVTWRSNLKLYALATSPRRTSQLVFYKVLFLARTCFVCS